MRKQKIATKYMCDLHDRDFRKRTGEIEEKSTGKG
jgi:hypothetical protein